MVVIWQSKSTYGQHLYLLPSVWTWTTKILNRAGKSKTTGIPTSSGCKSPKDNWWTMWTIGPVLPGQATGAQNPNCPPLTNSPTQEKLHRPQKTCQSRTQTSFHASHRLKKLANEIYCPCPCYAMLDEVDNNTIMIPWWWKSFVIHPPPHLYSLDHLLHPSSPLD